MKPSFTMQNVFAGIMSVFIMALMIFVPNVMFNGCDPKTVDNVKTCQSVVTNSAVVGLFLGSVGIILGVFVPFFQSIKPQDIRDELVDQSGPTHGTLPKGFSSEQQKGKDVE